jgi:hypothetical protein
MGTEPRNWVRAGLLALPISALLTFWTALDPQPDPSRYYADWSRHVTTTKWVLTHVLGSGGGVILGIFGVFALAVYLANSRAGRLSLVAMVVTIFGQTLFLMAMGVSAFAAPQEGQAYLAGIEGYAELPPSFASATFAVLGLLVVVLLFVGNLLLAVGIWRSGTLPKVAGVLWAAAAVLMYPLGLVVAAAVTGSTPPTVLAGALLLAASGAWLAWSAFRPSATAERLDAAQPSLR